MAVSPSPPARPLKLLNPRNSREAKIRGRLERDSTNADWLPESLSPELDALRNTQRKHISQMAEKLDEHTALVRKYREEDETYNRHLEGVFAEDEDSRDFTRTPKGERDAALDEIAVRFWAAAALCADTCDEIVQMIQKQEGEILLPGLKLEADSAMEAYRAKIKEAEDERAKVWHLQRLGRWIQQQADDHAYKRTRMGEYGALPKTTFVEDPGAFNRAWHQKGNQSKPRPSLTNRPRLNPTKDQTGVVFPLDA